SLHPPNHVPSKGGLTGSFSPPNRYCDDTSNQQDKLFVLDYLRLATQPLRRCFGRKGRSASNGPKQRRCTYLSSLQGNRSASQVAVAITTSTGVACVLYPSSRQSRAHRLLSTDCQVGCSA